MSANNLSSRDTSYQLHAFRPCFDSKKESAFAKETNHVPSHFDTKLFNKQNRFCPQQGLF